MNSSSDGSPPTSSSSSSSGNSQVRRAVFICGLFQAYAYYQRMRASRRNIFTFVVSAVENNPLLVHECWRRDHLTIEEQVDVAISYYAKGSNYSQVAALRREVGGPSRPGPSAPVPTPATDRGSTGGEPLTNCLWCGLDGHWVPDCPKKAAGLSPEEAQRELGTLTLVRKLKEAIAAKRAAKAKRPASGSGRNGGGSNRDGGGRDGGGSGKRGRPGPGPGPGSSGPAAKSSK